MPAAVLTKAGSRRGIDLIQRDPNMSPKVHQTSYELLREALRSALAAAAGSGCDGSGIGFTRAIVALYALLGDHQVDRAAAAAAAGVCMRCPGDGAVSVRLQGPNLSGSVRRERTRLLGPWPPRRATTGRCRMHMRMGL